MKDARREPGVIAQRISDNGDLLRPACRIRDDRLGLEFMWTRNGYQWVGGGVDIQMLKMMRDTINDALVTLEREAGEGKK